MKLIRIDKNNPSPINAEDLEPLDVFCLARDLKDDDHPLLYMRVIAYNDETRICAVILGCDGGENCDGRGEVEPIKHGEKVVVLDTFMHIKFP